jgi:hypothetical protein
MTHVPIDGVRVGTHFIVCRLLKGIFNKRPPKARYVETWSIGQVLKYINGIRNSNDKMPLSLLSMKTAFLVAIISAERSSAISALSLEFMTSGSDEIRFVMSTLMKTTRQGSGLQYVVIPKYTKDKRICPLTCLKTYIKRTASLRKDVKQLFISYVKPHKAVVSTSIARWITYILRLAGIDTSTFRAHSTRSASTSKAIAQGIHLSDVLKAGNWASAKTFQRFYHRSVQSDGFAQAVLQ